MGQNAETKIQNQMMLDVGLRDDILLWRQQVGIFRAYDDPSRVVHVGQPGMADLGAIVRVKITPEMVGMEVGIALQPEVKTPKGEQRKKQIGWMSAVEKVGGMYRLVRSTSELLQMIDDAKAGRWR